MKARARGPIIALGVVLLIVGAVLFGGWVTQDRARLAGRVALLEDYIRAHGGTPPPAARGQPGETGRPGDTGASGAAGRAPTQAEVAAAVAAYLRANPPAKGRPPTMTEILTAVTEYLTEHPPPAGPSGAPGTDGSDGRDGTDGKDGNPGPPPTDEQIRTAVEAYLREHPLNCPDGYHAEQVTIVTAGGPRQANVCVSEGP